MKKPMIMNPNNAHMKLNMLKVIIKGKMILKNTRAMVPHIREKYKTSFLDMKKIKISPLSFLILTYYLVYRNNFIMTKDSPAATYCSSVTINLYIINRVNHFFHICFVDIVKFMDDVSLVIH